MMIAPVSIFLRLFTFVHNVRGHFTNLSGCGPAGREPAGMAATEAKRGDVLIPPKLGKLKALGVLLEFF